MIIFVSVKRRKRTCSYNLDVRFTSPFPNVLGKRTNTRQPTRPVSTMGIEREPRGKSSNRKRPPYAYSPVWLCAYFRRGRPTFDAHNPLLGQCRLVVKMEYMQAQLMGVHGSCWLLQGTKHVRFQLYKLFIFCAIN
jgi:hypothetical protein